MKRANNKDRSYNIIRQVTKLFLGISRQVIVIQNTKLRRKSLEGMKSAKVMEFPYD